jgi:hypothetical protein
MNLKEIVELAEKTDDEIKYTLKMYFDVTE